MCCAKGASHRQQPEAYRYVLRRRRKLISDTGLPDLLALSFLRLALFVRLNLCNMCNLWMPPRS